MKTLTYWFSAYAESHQNPTNKLIHNICVPIIFFVIVALVWKVSFIISVLATAGLAAFYYTLDDRLAIAAVIMVLLCVIIQSILGFGFFSLIVLFVVAWAGQFYGHKIEGKKPSFYEDLQFLLIGPLWVGRTWLNKLGINYKEV